MIRQFGSLAVSCMFAAEANTEHVFLQEVRSELLREMAYTCERESLDTKSSVDWWWEANCIVVQRGQKIFAV